MEKFDLIINSTLPVLAGNFEVVKAQMLEGIKLYEIEVTEENLPEAKKMATELNKLSTVINKVKSEKVKEISGPIETFKTLVAELVDIAQAGREKILAQVKVFEDKTRAKCQVMMQDALLTGYNEMGIREEFRTATVDDLVGVSKISTSGKLTKGSHDAVLKKVSELKMLQDKVDMRLLQLDNASMKAGLKSPLQRVHVQSFLMAPDDQYEIQLASLIGVEVKRQLQTTEAIKTEQAQRPMRYFACAPFAHTVADYDPPAQCPKCMSKQFTVHATLLEAQQAKPAIPPIPGATTPPIPMPPITPQVSFAPPPTPPATFNQERLHQMRQHLGDEVFFQMFKIVYQPISDRAFEEAVKIRPELIDALEWAKGV